MPRLSGTEIWRVSFDFYFFIEKKFFFADIIHEKIGKFGIFILLLVLDILLVTVKHDIY